ncbi:MAG: alpha/beta fold hydrolase [bacterium]
MTRRVLLALLLAVPALAGFHPPDRSGPFAPEVRRVIVPLSSGPRASLLYLPGASAAADRPGVVLGHGFLAPIARYDSLGRWLAGHGFRVLVAGYPDPGLGYPRARIPADLLAAADWLGPGPVALVGHSMGGGGAFTAAGRAPAGRVAALAAMSPHRVAPVPESLPMPVLVFAAGRDGVSPAARVRREFFEACRAPGWLVTLPTADHSSYLDDAPGIAGAWGRGDRPTALRAVRTRLAAFLRVQLLGDSACLPWVVGRPPADDCAATVEGR